MAFSYACFTLHRLLLPTVLVLSALFRPVGISFVYLLMFFISPFVPVATNRKFKGTVTAYFLILISLSTILILCHIGLQVSIIVLEINDIFGTCSFTEQLLRHVGFVDFRNLRPLAIAEWLVPDILVFVTAVVVYLVSKRLNKESVPGQLENGQAETARANLPTGADGNGSPEAPTTAATATTVTIAAGAASSPRHNKAGPNFDAVIQISPLFCLATLFFAAVLRPSVPGGIYFLIFLLSGSYWATFRSLKRGFAIFLRFAMVVIVLHLLCLVAYQNPWMQSHLSPNNLISRLIGLEPLITSSCANDIRVLIYDASYKLDSYFNPLVLCFSYFTLGLTTKNLIKLRIVEKRATDLGQQIENGSNKFSRQLSLMAQTSHGSSKKDSWTKTQRLNVSLRRENRPTLTEPTETTPLVRHHTRRKSRPHTTSEGQRPPIGDIPLDSLDGKGTDTNISVFDQISYGFVSIGSFIYQNSYIFTNILMMTWSIVYHSWLTFVLLLWANVLWMIPNQRKAMMRSSPFIVFYAELLLLAQYIYGMNLTNEELPSKVDTTGINLSQIGLDRPQEHGVQPCVPLMLKTLFLLMFWVTLRQFFKEKRLGGGVRPSALADIIAPLQLTLEGSISVFSTREDKRKSKFMKKIGSVIKNLLVRLWIWLLVLVIFLCAITGKTMTGFRICYMALFLFFLLVFQSSSKAWVKVMYGFWLFLIFYAMSILILIYTYQFDKFDTYWSRYLNISETLQSDIGLERYQTKDLFLHLASPTAIVILTVIQVHYFHNRFIASLQDSTVHAEAAAAQAARVASPRLSGGPSLKQGSASNIPDIDDVRQLIRQTLKRILSHARKILRNMKNIFWRFLELHIMKAVYIAAFVCAVSQVCLFHIVFVALCLLGIVSRLSVQTFVSRIISFIVTIIILAKMIYQITYLDHSHYDVNCENSNITGNSAVWFGLQKASAVNGGLIGLLKKYIIYMVMVTMHAVVSLRQYQMRVRQGQPAGQDHKVLFPNIERADAEKNMRGMIKYLFNYGFYKLGWEVSLIALVATITYRQDIVAVAYAAWLIPLFTLHRRRCARIWPIFVAFVGLLIFFEYLLLLAMPPNMCIVYPWLSTQYSLAVQQWLMFPGDAGYDHTPKLIFDFILLLILDRQRRVYYIEGKHRHGEPYPGGSNRNVVKDIANLGQVPFRNPTRDFLSHIRNYLDIFKNIVLCGFFWITLGVTFIAGTAISDILALGYLAGAFVFLWQGSEFYLRPIRTILHSWQVLIYYNMGSIVVKTCLQFAGCIFMDTLKTNCCWLVHLLGISCTARPEIINDDVDFPDCPTTATQRVLIWDAICFGFLIMQLRIFKSHYFCHIIIDTKANSVLASRGAEIIEDLRQKQIRHQQNHEMEVLQKIKRKMEKIRATQQRIFKPADKQTHLDVVPEVQVNIAPLARHSSFSSCQGSGYLTPDDEDEEQMLSSTQSTSESSEEHAQLLDNVDLEQQVNIECDELVSDMHTDYADMNSSSEVDDSADRSVAHLQLPEISVLTGQQVSVKCIELSELQVQKRPSNQSKQNSASSDMMTIPLDGFLDTNRLSICSAPNSDFIAILRDDSSEESVEVFAPTPYESLPVNMHTLPLPTIVAPTSYSLSVNVSGGSSVISSNLNANTNGGAAGRQRQSSVNAVSWNETVSIQCAPKERTVNAEFTDDTPVTLRDRSLHRRHLSMGNASYSTDDPSTRRYSNISTARDELYLRAAARPNSWGPVEHSSHHSRPYKRRLIKTHPQAVRAGDYYMFEDMDEKFELDIIEGQVDFLRDHEDITDSEKRITRRKTIVDVWKDLTGVDRRKSYSRKRSYASAPGSRIGIKAVAETDVKTEEIGGGVRTSTLSEPYDYAPQTASEDASELIKTEKAAKGVRAEKAEKAEKVEQVEQEPKPSTSREASIVKDEDTDELKEKDGSDADIPVEPRDSSASLEANPIVRLMEGFLVSLAVRLNRFSRNYRYVNKILAAEKKALKDVKNIHRLGRGGAVSMLNVLKKSFADSDDWDSDDDQHEDASREPTSSVRAADDTLNTDISPPPTQTTQTPQDDTNPTNENTPIDTATGTKDDLTIQTLSQDQQQQQQQEPTDPHVIDIIELPIDTVDGKEIGPQARPSMNSLAKVSKTEATPEIRIREPSIERRNNGSGSLSKQCSYDMLDSESDRFLEEEDFESRDHHILVEVAIATYFAILSNTDLICYIVVFVNQVVNASIISLPLPIMVFLWGTLSVPRPTKTFWVTLIAYTQAIVFIKCVFQFKLIWANYINLPNQPLAPAKILGVEMNPNYASYDLVLLLVLFFHRFILKSQGLWKSDYQEEILKEEEELLKSEELSRPNQHGADSSSDLGATDEPVPSGSRSALVPPDKTLLALSTSSVSSGSDHGETYTSSIKKFFYNLMHRPRLPSDVYALMFLCDFINFFVLLFGFTAFGSQQSEDEATGGVQTYLAENKVPIPFLIMLLVQFILIVIDRALYLRKALVKKIIFHFLSVIGIHIWMFFVVPAVTERSFYSLAPPVIFYIIKCFYMLLSSYQIKCGYPKRILGNFLTKGFSLVNMIAFKIYMLIPFLYELRTILDWVCTDSTMTVFDWLKMEDIFSDIYLVKCTRQMETDFPAMRAQKKTLFTKLLLGGNIILLIVIAVWGPLCLFALGNAVGQSNIPYEVTLSIRIGQHDPIYHTSNREVIYTFTDPMYESMQNAYSKDRGAITFLTGYDAEDTAILKLPTNSPSLWSISPPDRTKLLDDLKNDQVPITTRFRYSLTRTPPAKGLTGTVAAEVVSTLDDHATRTELIDMLEGKPGVKTVKLLSMVPKFVKVLNSGEITVVNQLMPKNNTYRPLIIKMHPTSTGTGVWWEIRDYCEDDFFKNTLNKLPMAACDGGIVIYTFNDKKFPSTFSFLTAGGIIGLYTTFVLLASRVLKSFISGQNRKIMFEDLPYVDRVLQLCLDIYLVREALEFALEEDLFAKLIFLYRSPETMIKWTRPKEELADDETDTSSVRSLHRLRVENS